MKPLRIGTRGSALALWQSRSIARALRETTGVESELVIIKTSGDKFQQTSFSQMGTKGVFIKELEDALLDERVDLAVHSMKDVPTELPEGLTIAAIGKREDVRDALLSSNGAVLASLPRGARVGTSSLRRQSQLLHARPDLRMLELRGNVDTRIEKLRRGDYDAIVLAKAGLDRLGLSGNISEVLPHEVSLPAAGQGAIGIEARAGDAETLRALRAAGACGHALRCRRGARRAGRSRRRLPGADWSLGTRRKWKSRAGCSRALPGRITAHRGKGFGPDRTGRGHRHARGGKTIEERRGGGAGAREPWDRRMSADRPLAGKRIVITRTVEQARDLMARLETMGASVLLFPAVSFSEPSDTAAMDQAIRSLADFHWILFTSANAVRFFAGRCRKLGVEPSHGVIFRCAAVGPATASVLAAEGFSVDHVAHEFLGTALAHELAESLSGKKVLLPRSERARPDLPKALKAAGAEVTEVVAYHTGGVGAIDPAVMHAVREAEVDVISFFSPSAVENLRGELGDEAISRIAAKAALAAVGPVTAAALRNAGLPVAFESPLATAESMAAAIANYFSRDANSRAGAL